MDVVPTGLAEAACQISINAGDEEEAMSEERWADELLPDQPKWVRDLIAEELARNDAEIERLQALLAEKDETIDRMQGLLETCDKATAELVKDAARYRYAQNNLRLGRFFRDSIADCGCEFMEFDDDMVDEAMEKNP